LGLGLGLEHDAPHDPGGEGAAWAASAVVVVAACGCWESRRAGVRGRGGAGRSTHFFSAARALRPRRESASAPCELACKALECPAVAAPPTMPRLDCGGGGSGSG
jgi:hypothetical protein